jgi:RNA polymerase sigma-70 factor (ECF subfamily)
MSASEKEVTLILQRLRAGDQTAEDELIPLVYDELRALARWHLRAERVDHTLQATAIVHEAYLRMRGYDVDWQNREHFFGVAGRVMRHILVDYARKSKSIKRSGSEVPFEYHAAIRYAQEHPDDVISVDQALDRLTEQDPRLARIVELRFFAGCSVEETATMLGLSERTIKRDWNAARALLHAQIGESLER